MQDKETEGSLQVKRILKQIVASYKRNLSHHHGPHSPFVYLSITQQHKYITNKKKCMTFFNYLNFKPRFLLPEKLVWTHTTPI